MLCSAPGKTQRKILSVIDCNGTISGLHFWIKVLANVHLTLGTMQQKILFSLLSKKKLPCRQCRRFLHSSSNKDCSLYCCKWSVSAYCVPRKWKSAPGNESNLVSPAHQFTPCKKHLKAGVIRPNVLTWRCGLNYETWAVLQVSLGSSVCQISWMWMLRGLWF